MYILLFATVLVAFIPLHVFALPSPISDLLCSYFTRHDIYRAFLIRAASQPASQPALTPAVILQATRHVNYYANKQCETSVPTSHKTARIPSDFRAHRDSASALRMIPASLFFPIPITRSYPQIPQDYTILRRSRFHLSTILHREIIILFLNRINFLVCNHNKFIKIQMLITTIIRKK